MSKLHDVDAVASACRSTAANVGLVLPGILDGLQVAGILSSEVASVMLATIAVETNYSFKPVCEAYWLPLAKRIAWYDAHQYAEINSSTHQRYYGRGLLQHTGLPEYQQLTDALDHDFINNPNDLLVTSWAVPSAINFFVRHPRLIIACNIHDWATTRVIVNGGCNGIADYLSILDACLILSHQG